MTKSLPPASHIIDPKYLPNYNQSPFGLCYTVTLFNQFSNYLAKKYDCKIQLSLWEFINCFEKFIDAKNDHDEDPNISMPEIKFSKGKKFKLVLEAVGSFDKDGEPTTLDSALTKEFENQLIFPKLKQLTDREKFLSPLLDIFDDKHDLGNGYIDIQDFNTLSGQFVTIIDPKTFNDIQVFTLYENGKATTNTEGSGIRPKYRHKYYKVSVRAVDIEDTDISLDDILENSNLNSRIDTIKNIRKQGYGFTAPVGVFLTELLTITDVPLTAICKDFNGDAESQDDYNFAPSDDCFGSNNCTVKIALTNQKPTAGNSIRNMVGLSENSVIRSVSSLDTAIAILADDQVLMWSCPAFLTALLIQASDLHSKIEYDITNNIYTDRNSSLDNHLQEFMDVLAPVVAQCSQKKAYEDFLIDGLNSIFRDKIITDTIDISSILMFKTSTLELDISCDDNTNWEPFGGVGHAMTVYGYDRADKTTTLYVKNSWSGNKVLSNKFKIVISNNTILTNRNGFQKASDISRFGSLNYIKRSDIQFKVDNEDICSCCNLSSSSSSGGMNLSSSSSSSSSNNSSSSSSSSSVPSVYACGFGLESVNGEFIYSPTLSQNQDNNVYSNGTATLFKSPSMATWAITPSNSVDDENIIYFSLNPFNIYDNNWILNASPGLEPLGVTQPNPC